MSEYHPVVVVAADGCRSVSLKDQLKIKGLETVMGQLFPSDVISGDQTCYIIGYVSWIGKYANSNSVLVDILLDAGAIPFVRTNVPQTLMVKCHTSLMVPTHLNSQVVVG